MESYCIRCKKYTENKNPRVSNTSNGKTMILSKCAVCSNEKSRFIKNQESKKLLGNLGLRKPLRKVPILGDILFWEYKINEIVNEFLAGDKFIPEMHFKKSGFTLPEKPYFPSHGISWKAQKDQVNIIFLSTF